MSAAIKTTIETLAHQEGELTKQIADLRAKRTEVTTAIRSLQTVCNHSFVEGKCLFCGKEQA